ncbi:MAG: HAD-IIA family hydrolase [Nitrosomonadales bacterium]
MTAIILAAGLGTRLRPITDKKPKCMVKVAGRAILQRQIDAYLAAKVDKIIVVAGYRSEVVERMCSAYGNHVQIVRNNEYSKTNNMYSLYLALKQLGNEPFLLSNGDVVYDPGIINDIIGQEGAYIAADHNSYSEESMKIVVQGGCVKDISKQIDQGRAYGCSIDLYKFDLTAATEFKLVIEEIIETRNSRNEWTEVALQTAIQNNRILMRPFDISKRNWVEIDNFADLSVADRLFSTLRLRDVKLFLVDLDGTLYLGDQPITGASKFVNELRLRQKPHWFVSNNSARSKAQYVEKLREVEIPATVDNIVLSTDGAIRYLQDKLAKRINVLGTVSLCEAVSCAGLSICTTDCDYVLIGYDTELTYEKLATAALLINSGCPYIATHGDVVCPTSKGPIPDIGSMLALLERATQKQPERIFGKPSPEMVAHILTNCGVASTDAVFIGDRLYTDMKMARAVNAPFILVLSGETRREDVEELEDNPDLIVDHVGILAQMVAE